jgi:hypothetical protein
MSKTPRLDELNRRAKSRYGKAYRRLPKRTRNLMYEEFQRDMNTRTRRLR